MKYQDVKFEDIQLGMFVLIGNFFEEVLAIHREEREAIVTASGEYSREYFCEEDLLVKL